LLWQFALSRPALPQPHARPAAILGDELDVGQLEGGGDPREVAGMLLDKGVERGFTKIEIKRSRTRAITPPLHYPPHKQKQR
jgi:hypothetical protein